MANVTWEFEAALRDDEGTHVIGGTRAVPEGTSGHRVKELVVAGLRKDYPNLRTARLIRFEASVRS